MPGSPAHPHLKSDICLFSIQSSSKNIYVAPSVCQTVYIRHLWFLTSHSLLLLLSVQPWVNYLSESPNFKYCPHSCFSRMDPGDSYSYLLYVKKEIQKWTHPRYYLDYWYNNLLWLSWTLVFLYQMTSVLFSWGNLSLITWPLYSNSSWDNVFLTRPTIIEGSLQSLCNDLEMITPIMNTLSVITGVMISVANITESSPETDLGDGRFIFNKTSACKT